MFDRTALGLATLLLMVAIAAIKVELPAVVVYFGFVGFVCLVFAWILAHAPVEDE